jgi:hypothetical protein
MANPHRGEVNLKVGEKNLTLRLGINAIAEIETLLDMGINEIAASLSDPEKLRIGTLRAIAWGALREKHPALSLTDVGEIIDEAGAPAVMEAVQLAFERGFPSPEGGDSPPPKAGQDGTGKPS